MGDNIETIIKNANLETICDPIEGDCESVAVALHRVFNAESFVCIYDPTADDHPVHATARINGELYDGRGKQAEGTLIDYISYLKLSDFPDTIATPEEMESEMQNAREEFSTDKYGTQLLSYNETIVQQVINQLEKSKNEI